MSTIFIDVIDKSRASSIEVHRRSSGDVKDGR